MPEVVTVLPDNRVLVFDSFTGPTSYPSGGFTHRVANVTAIDRVILLGATGGYIVDAAEATVTGNEVTIVVRQCVGSVGPSGPAPEVPAGTDLSGVTFHLLVVAR